MILGIKHAWATLDITVVVDRVAAALVVAVVVVSRVWVPNSIVDLHADFGSILSGKCFQVPNSIVDLHAYLHGASNTGTSGRCIEVAPRI